MAKEHAVRIGARIAAAREEAGLTQRELADLIPGKSDGTQVSGWERGEHRVSDDTLDHIARILKKPVAWFHADEPEPGSPDLMSELVAAKPNGRLEELMLQVLERVEALERELRSDKRGRG